MSNRWPIMLVIVGLIAGRNAESTKIDEYGVKSLDDERATPKEDYNIKTALIVAHTFQMGMSAKEENASNKPIRHLPFQAHPDAKEFETVQKSLEMASEILISNHKLSYEEMMQLGTIDLKEFDNLQVIRDCKKKSTTPPCDYQSPYRTYDGSCNNPNIPRWGSPFQCLKRQFQANYKNVADFRESVLGGPLPTPRTVSLKIHNQVNTPSDRYNNLVVAFGQFLAHDITYVPLSTAPDNSMIECCSSQSTNQQCAPVLISSTDPFYSKYNVTCLNNARSAPCASCKLGKRNQMTQVTAYIDGSAVYSSTEKDAHILRNYDGTGTLRTQKRWHGELLPPSNDYEHDECSQPEKNKICFLAGDDRCNLHPSLTAMHTVFLREHNNVARRLGIMCPHWGEEKLFQEARRIIGAELQMITYNELLPLLLGPKYMEKYHLEIKDVTTTYGDKINPTIWPEFNTAGFRFGHSVATRPIAWNWPSVGNQSELRNYYFQPFYLYDGLIDPLFEKITGTAAQIRNRHVVHDVTEYLMKKEDKPYGYDLIAIDITRGRDHGLPTYTQTLNNYGVSNVRVKKWADLYSMGLIPPHVIDLLKGVYRDPQDIDLHTGLLCETAADGALFGPTTASIIGFQFYELKYGDRFYFQHGHQSGSFTEGQRTALKGVTLSQIICSNSNSRFMPVRALELPSASNPMKSCPSMGRIDLMSWMHCE